MRTTTSGPSCSKRLYLNELVSGQNIDCSSKYNILFTGILLKNVGSFFSKNISVYAIFDDQHFNDTLTVDIVSFEQLGPGSKLYLFKC